MYCINTLHISIIYLKCLCIQLGTVFTSGHSIEPQLLPTAVEPQSSLEPSQPIEPQLLPVEPVPRVDNPSTVAKDGMCI